jgi:four helix bundle protein
MGDYRKLRVWKVAHALTLEVYESTRAFPPSERYGITSQIRRAAASIPANLAEGCGRDSDAEIARFARISLGSANELEYHILLARDLGLMPASDHQRLEVDIGVVKGMLARLASSLATTD